MIYWVGYAPEEPIEIPAGGSALPKGGCWESGVRGKQLLVVLVPSQITRVAVSVDAYHRYRRPFKKHVSSV